ncbi:MAG TPA: aminotransferase class V-fold PLP-dependent enzyme [Hypericibacter adhaerens]|jgi:isopenicillin-N epimerase|uniref:Isopenicillin-N epimerase n=1 Tax=Hypericibacter adhaerens TaxID=2602016 RepID=A0A5J6N3G3_9PROT|nr:aminotransferase class V-fold PLP-dependent enzyme [Hypericibacter adhaerens]QEX24341.1 isopenicillin-N epimerase [Hypericibacter adhaerens]HWA44780.1 aminotransferase class V-fold PLP-dependent enzyme [Hypericibacter adhaerens]
MPPDQAPAANRPDYGRRLLPLWALDPAIAYLNHGGYGATPHEVLAEQQRWRLELERGPTRFMQKTLPEALRANAAELARFLGADPQDLVFVENATQGMNAVLRSLEFSPGDELLTTTHVYNAVRNTMRHLAERFGATYIEAPLPYPMTDAQQAIDALTPHINARTKLLALDLVTSPTALILPVAALAAKARAVGARVLVDAAHAPGQIEFDLPGLGADYVTGNAHKWLFAPKGTAFLWARRDRQAGLHPTTISHGLGQGFIAEFDWVGTRDPSAWLATGAAIAFYRRMGDGAIRAHNHALANEAATLLSAALGGEEGQSPRLRGAMATVRLEGFEGQDRPAALALNDRLWREHGIEVPIIPFGGSLWVRVSAQIYNEIEDYRRLADALLTLRGA